MTIEDPQLPAAVHLLGDGAWDVVAAGVGALGGELRRLDPAQVIYRPGSELTVRYDAAVEWADGAVVEEVLCVGTSKKGAPPGTVPLTADGLEIGLWRYPFDPALPGLEAAVTPPGVAAIAGAIVGSSPQLTMRAYRPARRAVVHAVGELGEAYLKVVRPSAFDAMVAIHHALSTAGLPVPEVLAGDPDQAILVLRALPGDVLRDRLRAGARPWPPAGEIVALLDRLAEVEPPSGLAPVSPISRGVATHLTMLERAFGTPDPLIDEVRARLVEAWSAGDPHPVMPVGLIHGDLHEAQLLVEGAAITGLLDIDGVAPGDRADDLGRLLGHLSAMALGVGRHRRAVDTYVGGLRTQFAKMVDPDELDLRAASVVAGLAVGPFRVQMEGWQHESRRRLALARWWAGHTTGARPA
jgi:aminoglycoside phosphotransferase (APT) family kinase protein